MTNGRWIVALVIAGLGWVPWARAAMAGTTLATAQAALQAGRADEALGLLQAALKADPKDAEAENLRCRVEFTVQRFDQAVEACERAVNLNPQSSRYHLWLGRALGEKADHAVFTSAFSLGKRTREEFERAVAADPRDAEALADLGEFYYSAPGVMGGGTDKALGVVSKLDGVDPVRAHEMRARMANLKKDTVEAEREFKVALKASPRPAFQWMTLASFYGRHERLAEMVEAVKSGLAAAEKDKHSVVALYNGASVLMRANQEPELAVKLLETYVASPEKTEEGPAFEALTRLANLRKQMGDGPGAQRDRAAALALAREYKPALELKF